MNDHILSAAIVLLNLADAITTYHILKRGGRELWPPMRLLMAKVGVMLALAATKMAVALLLAYMVQGNLTAQAFCIVLFAGIVARNFVVLKRLRE